ncbi:hypothetical protein [Alteromonas lipotrueiana]|uniref:hypothetical protein n=1 Tax=Alteromonas lipotrueiana TaxID=2803815 RepID=UPI001C47EB93|nr:hypothetical protein [Alteromonas lipotrueiana]
MVRIFYFLNTVVAYALFCWQEEAAPAYWFAQNLPSFLSVFIGGSLLAMWQGNYDEYGFVYYLIGACLYEVMQIYIPERTFDWWDIFAILIGGLLYYGLAKAVKKSKVVLKIWTGKFLRFYLP